jgi:hypothetical protein
LRSRASALHRKQKSSRWKGAKRNTDGRAHAICVGNQAPPDVRRDRWRHPARVAHAVFLRHGCPTLRNREALPSICPLFTLRDRLQRIAGVSERSWAAVAGFFAVFWTFQLRGILAVSCMRSERNHGRGRAHTRRCTRRAERRARVSAKILYIVVHGWPRVTWSSSARRVTV